MEITLLVILASVIVPVSIYFFFQIKTLKNKIDIVVLDAIDNSRKLYNVIEKLELRLNATIRDNFISKTDSTWKELSLVLKDALKEGEGVFSVKKLDENDYFIRLDPDKMFRRGGKKI